MVRSAGAARHSDLQQAEQILDVVELTHLMCANDGSFYAPA
jgi:hypothetical protein